MQVPEIFDRHARRMRRDRAARSGEPDFLRAQMIEGLADRLSMVTRNFATALEIGCGDGGFAFAPGVSVTRCDAGALFAARLGGIQADEDRLPFAAASFDLIVSAGVLDSVNDLPGALTLIRHALKPDGLFLGAFIGAGSLPTLRAAIRAVEVDHPVARIHPQIEVRSAGDLLMRAGFSLPVADSEALAIRYVSIARLITDLREASATNMMIGRQPLSRETFAQIAGAFAGAADDDGRTTERFEFVYLTGWAPDPSQPKAARRGSGTQSLADALKPMP